MKKYILILILIVSCKTDEKKEFFENGNIKKEYSLFNDKIDGEYREFFDNGNLKLKHFYRNGIKTDSSIYFFNNDGQTIKKIDYYNSILGDTLFVKKFNEHGDIKEKGLMVKDLKWKKWKYFNKKRINKIVEYFIINKSQYTNQGWYLNKSGDTILGKGTFMDIMMPDSAYINEDFTLKIFLKNPIVSENSKIKLFIDLDPANKVNYKFDNLDEIKFVEIENHPDNEKFTGTYLNFSEKGLHRLRGYLLEYIENDSIDKSPFFKKEHKKYFDLSIFIKDTINQ